MANIGINVLEVEGSAAPAVVGAATSVAGFAVRTARGAPYHPTRVTRYSEFVERFGGPFPGGLGAYLVRGFFDNGGRTAYISRVTAASGDAAAQLVLNDRAAAPQNTLRLEAGYRGEADPGTWGNDLYIRVSDAAPPTVTRPRETARATITAPNPLGATTDMTALTPLTVVVDGQDTPTAVTFQGADFTTVNAATRQEIVDAINRRTSSIIASLSGTNNLVLTSSGNVAGRGLTSLQLTAANAPLGFPAVIARTGGTLASLGATALITDRTDGFQVGDAVRIADASDNSRVAFAKITRIVPGTGEIQWLPAVANPNTYAGAQTTITVQAFDLTVAMGGTEDDKIVERWTGLSREADVPNSAVARVNDLLSGSRYVRVVALSSATPAGRNMPATRAFTRLGDTSAAGVTAGTDGTPTANDFTGDPAAHTGFFAFDAYDIQLLTCERTESNIARAGIDYCQQREDCVYIGSVPEGIVPAAQAVAYGQLLQSAKSYGALYGPWIRVQDPLAPGGGLRQIPPSGHVMGVCARIESTRGIWKAPAGDEALIRGALDVEYRLSDAEHTDLVKNGSINGIRAIPGAGIVVDASRTLSTDTRWLYLNVRLLFNYVKGSLKRGLRWVRQEPNKDTLWSAITHNTVRPFLMGLYRQGAFGTGKPDEVFTIVCDASNNPPSEVDQGNLTVEVYFYPSRPAETIIIKVGQQASGAPTSSEA